MNEIITTLRLLGITPLYKGFWQLLYIILLTAEDNFYAYTAKDLYMEVGTYFNCTWQGVERNIRTLARRAWKINPTFLCELARCSLQSAPSAAFFLAILYGAIR